MLLAIDRRSSPCNCGCAVLQAERALAHRSNFVKIANLDPVLCLSSATTWCERAMYGYFEKRGTVGSTIRILLVEDFELARQFMSTALAKEPTFQVIAEVSDGLLAVEEAIKLQPDVILLDIGLPGLNGIEAARRIRKGAPKAKILFVSQQSSPELVQAALEVGGSGYVLKSDAGLDLVKAVNAVAKGETFLSRALRSNLMLCL